MTWPQDAYVGQKVICIDDKMPPFGYFGPKPELNKKYTIMRVSLTSAGEVALDLEELDKDFPLMPYGNWRASRFRPVQSTDKSVELLKAIKPDTKIEDDKFDKIKISEEV